MGALWHDLMQRPASAYGRVVVIALIATAVVVVLHFLTALATRPKSPPLRARWSLWEKLVYLVTILTVGVLGVTGFYSVIAQGSMDGWWLLVHVSVAGVFVVILALLALTWAQASRFTCTCCCGKRARKGSVPPAPVSVDPADDAPITTSTQPRAQFPGAPLPGARFFWLTRLTFWLIIVAGLVTAGSMLINMLPLLGTDDLNDMINVHRYAGLVLVVATILHFYGVWLTKLRLR